MDSSINDSVIHATTTGGTAVTIKNFEVVIQNGKPVLVFFVVDENGQHGIFHQNELTNYVER
jgi:hypothetical protein